MDGNNYKLKNILKSKQTIAIKNAFEVIVLYLTSWKTTLNLIMSCEKKSIKSEPSMAGS